MYQKLFQTYRIYNLAELIEATQDMHNRINAHARRDVHPSEVMTVFTGAILTDGANVELESERLSDNSIVYNIVF